MFNAILRLFINNLTQTLHLKFILIVRKTKDRPGGDCMLAGFTTTYAISAYHHNITW